MRPTPYVASLRIYEPLSAFEPVDRLRWQALVISESSFIFEEELALRRLVFPETPTGRPDGVHILEVDGERYVSPWATATRCCWWLVAVHTKIVATSPACNNDEIFRRYRSAPAGVGCQLPWTHQSPLTESLKTVAQLAATAHA